MMRVFKDEIVGWQDGKGAVEFGAAMMFLTSSDMMRPGTRTQPVFEVMFCLSHILGFCFNLSSTQFSGVASQ